MDIKPTKAPRPILRKPEWLRSQIPGGETYVNLREILRSRKLHTVCEEARCPNLGECWSGGTATFMVLGDVCTRGCRFCAVATGKHGIPVDPMEPFKVAEASLAMGLEYVVITSVDRDDLPDGGAGHFADVVRKVHELSNRQMMIEVLTPDFRGDLLAVETIARAEPTVFAHNLETTRSLTRRVRDARCGYDQSLAVLRHAKASCPSTITKSSIMLGLSETEDEIFQAMDDLLSAGVEILTFGQYLQPTPKHIPVESYITPETFERYAEEGKRRGFAYVASGPMIRSSYRAGELFLKHLVEERRSLSSPS